jgi:hypothetical protein
MNAHLSHNFCLSLPLDAKFYSSIAALTFALVAAARCCCCFVIELEQDQLSGVALIDNERSNGTAYYYDHPEANSCTK